MDDFHEAATDADTTAAAPSPARGTKDWWCVCLWGIRSHSPSTPTPTSITKNQIWTTVTPGGRVCSHPNEAPPPHVSVVPASPSAANDT